MIPIIDEAALRAVVTPALAVQVIRDAFRADGEGRAHMHRGSHGRRLPGHGHRRCGLRRDAVAADDADSR